jgi:DUF4097 and DUF4098 domain-containing protein YvlB
MKKELIVFSFVILIVIALSGCVDLGVETPGPEVSGFIFSEYDASDNTILSVSTVNGEISITSWSGENISLNATKRSKYGEDDLDKAEIVVSEIGNEIIIEIKHVQPIRSRAVDLDIKIPYNVTVKSASSTNGPIEVTNVKGNIVLTNTNGPIDVEDVDGYVKATTSNGGIDITGTTGVDDLISTNGGISAEIFDIENNVDIQTTNGGVDLYINPTLNSSIQISTTNGGITVVGDFINVTESSFNSFKGTIGSGEYTINVITVNGGIKISELEI